MKGKKIRSINFILWLSFLGFAAFIIILTWVFQATLLKTLFSDQFERDINEFGDDVYGVLKAEFRKPSEKPVPEYLFYIMNEKEDDYPAAKIYILKEDGDLMFPLLEDSSGARDEWQGYAEDKPEYALFNKVRQKLDENAGTDPVVMKMSDACYVYSAKLSAEDYFNLDEDAYLYISYSTEMSNMVYGHMTENLVLISIIVIFIALIISTLISMELTKPIAQITKAAKRMAKGDFTVDFTGRYAYAEMDSLAETLNYAKEEIGKSDELQKEVLANVTHDLKTPLTMIKAYASMIQEISGDNPQKRAKHTQVIIDESDRLTALVNDILNLSKIRSGMDSLKKETFNLSEFIHTVLERFEYLTEMQGYTLERDIEDELYTEADMEKMEQVIYNLVGNAVNYTGEDKKITVSLKRSGEGKIRFAVTDTGKGIPPEEISTIWDRYYRSAETHKRPIKGTGLGLSIVKTILIKHDFEYGVESEVGKGSTFFVLFPEK